jgi:hypothetical protein
MTAVTRKPLLINYLCDLNVGRSNMYVQTCARHVNTEQLYCLYNICYVWALDFCVFLIEA